MAGVGERSSQRGWALAPQGVVGPTASLEPTAPRLQKALRAVQVVLGTSPPGSGLGSQQRREALLTQGPSAIISNTDSPPAGAPGQGGGCALLQPGFPF